MIRFSLHTDARSRWILLWIAVWVVAAVAYAVPISEVAQERLADVTRGARERLIVEYRLWEAQPEYRGTPRAWTRSALWLLSDNQLLQRVRVLHRDLAMEIELDYRRDLVIAQSEVVLAAVARWALPVCALYVMGWLFARRRRAAPKPVEAPAKPAYSEAKYRP
jgi:hypothetical protein